MDTDLLIAATLGALMFFALVLRTNVALGILSLGAGYVLADLTTNSVVSTLYRLGVPTGNIDAGALTAMVLTFLPSLVVMIRFRGFQPGRLLEHIAPSLAYSLLLVLLILLQFPFEVQRQLEAESYVFKQFEYFRTFIVVGAVVIATFDVMAHEQKLKKKAKRRGWRKKQD